MRTNVPGSSDFDEPDPSELEDIPEVDFSRGERGRYARLFAHGFDVAIDGATAYRLRNSQTGVVVGEWAESRPLFVAALAQVAAGVPPEALAMDVRIGTRSHELESEGVLLVHLAQSALGVARRRPARVAEG